VCERCQPRPRQPRPDRPGALPTPTA
jgi:hypothetical protein